MTKGLRLCIAVMAVGMMLVAPAAAFGTGAHSTDWHWSRFIASSHLNGKQACVSTGCGRMNTAVCTGQGRWIWNTTRTTRLYRHFHCRFIVSGQGILSATFHITGRSTGVLTNKRIVVAQPRPTPPPAPSVGSGTYLGVGGGHWIRDVIDRGRLIELEDGSLWQINSFDYIDAILWIRFEDIVVVDDGYGIYRYRLINVDDGSEASARYLGRR